jgi:DNA ligase-1
MAGVSPRRRPFSSPWPALGLILLGWLGLLGGAPAWALDPPPAPDPASPALLLANSYHPGIDLDRYWVSEKLDGVRARWDGARLISRGGRPIPAPVWFLAGFPTTPLDGELWMGRGTFERMSAMARRGEPDPVAWGQARFMVFDLPGQDGPFGQRLAALHALLTPSPSPYLVLIEQFRVPDHASLMARLREVVAGGGEGLMLHREDSPYRAGRSDDLLKVKPYQDAEARVVGHLPGKGRFQGMLGALLVEEADGTRFRLGTGFSHAQRRDPPGLGSLITFKYQGRTAKGTPRFASFLRVRLEE